MQNKQTQRQFCLNKRNSLDKNQIDEFSKIICEKVLSIVNNELVMSYSSISSEVDTSLINKSINVCLPVIKQDSQMDAYMLNNNIIINNYGIVEPNPHKSKLVKPENIKYIIVPIVGFDEKLNRLGHGKGYYDNFLLKTKNATKIGIAFEVQKLNEIITDEHDIKMDYIISESNIYKLSI